MALSYQIIPEIEVVAIQLYVSDPRNKHYPDHIPWYKAARAVRTLYRKEAAYMMAEFSEDMEAIENGKV
jgi:hypothetical protein